MRIPPKTVLCASDLSKTGDGAVALAYALAGPGSTVHLLHVHEPILVHSPLDSTVLFAAPASPAKAVAAEEKAQRHLRALVPEAASARDVHTELHVVHESGAAGAIEQEARRLKVDLIVLGTRGRGGVARALLGSVANSVMRHAKVPVALFHDAPA